MLYLNYANRLQERGMHSAYIKELTGVSIESCKNKPLGYISRKQLDVCLSAVKHNKYGLLEILNMFPECNPNVIYRHIKAYLQPFNANILFKELILVFAHDGVSVTNISVLIKPLIDNPPSYSMLSHLVGGVCVTRSALPFGKRRQLTMELVKYIKYKGVAQDYRGYFLLRTLYPEAEGRIIASAIVKSIDHLVKSCNLCGSEFLTTSKHALFCDKCRKRHS